MLIAISMCCLCLSVYLPISDGMHDRCIMFAIDFLFLYKLTDTNICCIYCFGCHGVDVDIVVIT